MANFSGNANSAFCPNCDERVNLPKKIMVGQFVTCNNCEDLLEIVSVKPVELDWAYAEKLEPQPQVDVALGLLKTKPRPMTSSLKSTVTPVR